MILYDKLRKLDEQHWKLCLECNSIVKTIVTLADPVWQITSVNAKRALIIEVTESLNERTKR